jgi:hypothetical protein
LEEGLHKIWTPGLNPEEEYGGVGILNQLVAVFTDVIPDFFRTLDWGDVTKMVFTVFNTGIVNPISIIYLKTLKPMWDVGGFMYEHFGSEIVGFFKDILPKLWSDLPSTIGKVVSKYIITPLQNAYNNALKLWMKLMSLVGRGGSRGVGGIVGNPMEEALGRVPAGTIPGLGRAFDIHQNRLTEFQRGGLAVSPMIARLAEKEPELVVPLSRIGGLGTTINVYVTGNTILDDRAGKVLADNISKQVLSRLGQYRRYTTV